MLAAAVAWVARRRGLSTLLAAVVAVGVTALAELVIEIAEYPVLYADRFHRTAYYDTIADMASTLVGALAGVAGVTLIIRRRASRNVPHTRLERGVPDVSWDSRPLSPSCPEP